MLFRYQSLNTSQKMPHSTAPALAGGALAGLSVDAILFPIDTIKTRLQSQKGLLKSGGFSRLYAGIGPLLMGSMPSSATFFLTYEAIRRQGGSGSELSVLRNMLAASAGEVTSCLARVPCELIKQRAQANSRQTSWEVLRGTVQEGGLRGLYRGYAATVSREIPFSLVQYPLWEYLKRLVRGERDKLAAWQSAVVGAVAGGIAAAVTTPIDVAKTRIMLSTEPEARLYSVLVALFRKEGSRALYAGLGPRVLQISLGGAIFLGIYDQAFYWVQTFLNSHSN